MRPPEISPRLTVAVTIGRAPGPAAIARPAYGARERVRNRDHQEPEWIVFFCRHAALQVDGVTDHSDRGAFRLRVTIRNERLHRCQFGSAVQRQHFGNLFHFSRHHRSIFT